MRPNVLKKHSTKAERKVIEVLKSNKIPFRFKDKVKGREVDFIIGNVVLEIDGHLQDGSKNHLLAEAGYTPIHITNNDIFNNLVQLTKLIKEIYGRK